MSATNGAARPPRPRPSSISATGDSDRRALSGEFHRDRFSDARGPSGTSAPLPLSFIASLQCSVPSPPPLRWFGFSSQLQSRFHRRAWGRSCEPSLRRMLRFPAGAKLFPLKLGGVVLFEAVNRNGPFGVAVAHFNAVIIRAYRIGVFQCRRDAKWIFAVFEEKAIFAIWDGRARR